MLRNVCVYVDTVIVNVNYMQIIFMHLTANFIGVSNKGMLPTKNKSQSKTVCSYNLNIMTQSSYMNKYTLQQPMVMNWSYSNAIFMLVSLKLKKYMKIQR